MEYEKKMIKDDINFLEYPNWVIDRKNNATTWRVEKAQGQYEILSPLGLPKHFDKIVIYFLLYKLYKEHDFDAYSIKTTRYEIAKNVFSGVKSFGKNKYDRIIKSLRRWQAISINFEGVFYEGDGHAVRYFSVIDEVVLRKITGEITIRFSESYVRQLKETKFYKLIDFDQYKKLHKASSARLYEILCKNFKERDEWVINIQVLAEKITFEKREGLKTFYPSDVLRYLKPSVNEINKKTDIAIRFTYNTETGTCLFKKLKKTVANSKEKASEKPVRVSQVTSKQIRACMGYFESLDDNQREEILEAIKRQPFLEFLPNQEEKIFSYLSTTKQWTFVAQ